MSGEGVVKFDQSSLVKCRTMMIPLLFGLAMPLTAQWRYRISDPRTIPAVGSGWSVEPSTRALTAVFPVQTLPGDMPVSLAVRLNGSPALQQSDVYGIPESGTSKKPIWATNITTFPVFASVHFGYITAQGTFIGNNYSAGAVLTPTYVMEDGTVYKDIDFYAGTIPIILNQFGLAVTPTQSAPKTVSDCSLATYSANQTDLGTLAQTGSSQTAQQPGNATPAQSQKGDPFSVTNALKVEMSNGIGGAAAGAVGGAITGAAGGTLVCPVVGTVAGWAAVGVVGAGNGFVNGFAYGFAQSCWDQF